MWGGRCVGEGNEIGTCEAGRHGMGFAEGIHLAVLLVS